MPLSKFLQFIDLHSRAVRRYCDALGWDYEKFRISISDEGISSPELYLEDPNEGIIEKLSQFLEPTNQGSVFIIWDDVGMGKSSLKDYVIQSLEMVEDYHTILVTDPRLTPLQTLKVVASQLGMEIPSWTDRLTMREAVHRQLREISRKGIHLLLWFDEAEGMTKELLAELRTLSDLKGEDGGKVCKIILSGTPRLIEKIDEYIRTDPENVAAFDDRASLNTFRLSRWSARNIENYWNLLSRFCGGENPFLPEAAETVQKISEGKPRTIAQITKCTLNARAMEYSQRDGETKVSSEHVLQALKGFLNE
jgi:hypothetical protein